MTNTRPDRWARRPAWHRIGLMAAVLLAAMAGAKDAGSWGSVSVERLMANTAYETPLYVLDSGRPGQTLLVLGGVHGDEPGAWRAADALAKSRPPSRGRLLVIPKANRLAVAQEVRSTVQLGDLNRLYFGGPDSFPMTRMAVEIVDTVKRYDVDVVIDLHESWGFYEPSREGGHSVDLAALGQTVSPHTSEPSRALARALVARANRKLPADKRFMYHEFPPGHVDELIVALPDGVEPSAIPRKSALDLPAQYPGVVSILVEVGQQQSVRDRMRLQIVVVDALLGLMQAGGPRG